MSTAPPQKSVFVSYSHKDKKWLPDLKDALATLSAKSPNGDPPVFEVKYWIDDQILPSQSWKGQINAALAKADMAVLLLSQAFLASEFIRTHELPVLLEAKRTRDIAIFVVVVSDFDDNYASELTTLQFINAPNSPLDKMTVAGDPKQYWVGLNKAIRNVQAQATKVSLGGQGQTSGVFLVPHRQNPFFSGREDELAAIHEALQTGGHAGIVEAIKGLGGIGKTQLALEYAYRHIEDYTHIVWVRADTTTTLDEDYRALAEALKLPLPKPTIEAVRHAVKEWLSHEKGYLLILDNADDPAVAEPYLSVRPAGKVLVTSRSHNLTKLGVKRPKDLSCWSPEQGAEFLLKRIAVQADGDVELARTLSERLGGLPLALEQAGAYLAETESSLASYLDAYDRQGHKLLEKHGPEIGHQRTIATTWALNIEEIEKSSPASLYLLRAAAFLAPDKIPFELFENGAEAFEGELSKHLTDELAVGELLAPLRRFSLVTVDSTSRTFDVHRLVQSVVAASLSQTERDEWRSRILDALNTAFPDVTDYRNWSECKRLVPHAVQTVQGFEDGQAALLISRTGYLFQAQGDLTGAHPLYKRAQAIYEKVLGPEHPHTATSLNNLATLLRAQGDLSGARPLCERALAIWEKVLGPEHPDTALSLNNLAGLLQAQGDLSGARPLYERALAIWEKVLGPEHPDTATSLNNLALLLRAQGDLSAARPLYERALAIREKVLGPEHPDTATSLNNLASLVQAQGDLSGARPLYERALAICEKVLGPEHPDTATKLNDLGSLVQAQGDLLASRPLLEQALAIYEKVLGPEHPHTATSLNNLASLLQAQGDLSGARPLCERALAIWEKVLGPEHPDTAVSIWSLGALLLKEGDPAGALPLHETALDIYMKALPPYHPHLTRLQEQLANLYKRLDLTAEAANLRQKAAKGKAEFKRRNNL